MKAIKENYYVLNVSGYECYSPVWFKSAKSKANFKQTVKDSIHECVPSMLKKKHGCYISGYSLLESVIPFIEAKGFEKITPHLELSLEGECLYHQDKCNRRPVIIPKEEWKLIIAHNKIIDNMTYDELYCDDDDEESSTCDDE